MATLNGDTLTTRPTPVVPNIDTVMKGLSLLDGVVRTFSYIFIYTTYWGTNIDSPTIAGVPGGDGGGQRHVLRARTRGATGRFTVRLVPLLHHRRRHLTVRGALLQRVGHDLRQRQCRCTV